MTTGDVFVIKESPGKGLGIFASRELFCGEQILSDKPATDNIYREVIAKAREVLPVLSECDFNTETMWNSLLWSYKCPYFASLWASKK